MMFSLVLLTATLAQPGAAPGSPSPASTTSPASQPALARQKIAEGDQKWKDKDYRSASFLYQDAANADPKNVEALFKLGTAYAVLEYYAQAIERWQRVKEISTSAAVKKSADENIVKAKAKMAKAAAGNPLAAGKPPGSGPVAPATRSKAVEAYQEGVKHVTAQKYDAAVEKLTEAIKLEPNRAVAYVARGSAYLGLRRYSEAATDYEYALKIAPELSAPLYGLAESLRGLGRIADARKYYEQYAQSTATDVRPEYQARAREQAAALR